MTLDNIKNLDKEAFLDMLGLQPKRTAMDYVVPGLAVFGVGALVGAGLGLLLAPRPGKELRDDLARRIQQVPETLSHLPQRALDATHIMDGKA